MSKYTISCSSEQVEKSLKLGAEEEYLTAEEMTGWLDDKGVSMEVSRLYRNNPNWSIFVDDTQIVGKYYPTRKAAILSAIDVALDYLIKNKK